MVSLIIRRNFENAKNVERMQPPALAALDSCPICVRQDLHFEIDVGPCLLSHPHFSFPKLTFLACVNTPLAITAAPLLVLVVHVQVSDV
jgi:hypothetical protein